MFAPIVIWGPMNEEEKCLWKIGKRIDLQKKVFNSFIGQGNQQF